MLQLRTFWARREQGREPRWTHEPPGPATPRCCSLSLQSPEDAAQSKDGSPFLLLPRADAIRSKLIYTFYLIDHLQGLSHAIPRHNIQDFLDPRKQRKLMLTDHHQLVRFNITPVRNSVITPEKRLRNRIRVRCSRWPPLAMWASWVLHSILGRCFIICLIFLNMLVLMVKSEVMDKLDARLVSLKLSLEVTVWVILLIFIIEILLNWIVSFRDFWKSSWNVFDFSVTVVSVIPEFLGLAGITNSIAAMRIIRAFRVLRTLKLFSKFHQVRVIILAIAKTLKAMIFILLLFLFFFYVFAVSGIFFFESYSRSDRTDLEYSMYFRDFPNTLVTLFILFTMDHWYALLQDTWKIPEMSKVISSLYIILWLLVGSFMFRNIFVAITVTNFQTIRSDLAEEVKKIETQKKADLFKMQIRDSRRPRHSQQQAGSQPTPPQERLVVPQDTQQLPMRCCDNTPSTPQPQPLPAPSLWAVSEGSWGGHAPSTVPLPSPFPPPIPFPHIPFPSSPKLPHPLHSSPHIAFPSCPKLHPRACTPDQVPGGERGAGSRRRGSPSGTAVGVQGGDKAEHEDLKLRPLPLPVDWETYIHQNLQSLVEVDEEGQVVWPSDSLFRYLELLEQLQHNLEEHKRLQHYAACHQPALLSWEKP
uniref:Cation channel sperm associated 2 n=1 Tax=Pelodiscus sinensis TaxID=13735 RepID=K7FSE4_PELSI